MTHRFAWLMTIHSPDADQQRRGKIVISLSLAMIVMALSTIPLIMMTATPMSGFVTVGLGALLFAVVVALVRASYVNVGAFLLIGTISLAIIGSLFTSPYTVGGTPFFLSIAILTASIVLRPAQIWMVAAFNIASLALFYTLFASDPALPESMLRMMTSGILMQVMVGLIGFIGAKITARVLQEAQVLRVEAEQARAAVEQTNAALEARVAERTAVLSQVLEAQQAMTRDLQASLEAQEQLNQVIAEMSLPIIPVRTDVLVVPLVGNLDSARAAQLLTGVLSRIEAQAVRTVMLDVTGVPVIDSQVAQALFQTADATRLMGVETVMVGIRPEVAQALVSLGVDLGKLRTAATLQEGLVQLASQRNGKSMV